MDTKPAVSVLMPVFNGEKYLSEAIESILNQTFGDFELIIIDDGSTDGTAEILHEYAQHDDRIRIHHQDNHGIVFALNKGLELARGRFIARMDADDISLTGRFASQVKYLDSHPEISVLGGDARIIGQHGEIINNIHLSFAFEPLFIFWILLFENCITHSTVMMRTDAIKRLGGYDEKYLFAEDYYLWSRLPKENLICNLPEVVLFHRVHTGNVSQKNIEVQLVNSSLISQEYISKMVGKKIDLKIVNVLLRQKPETYQEAIDSIFILKILLNKFKLCKNDSASKKLILLDYGRRVYNISNNLSGEARLWPYLLIGSFTNPRHAIGNLTKSLQRLFSIS